MHKIQSYTLLALTLLALMALRLLLYWERLPLFLDVLIHIFLLSLIAVTTGNAVAGYYVVCGSASHEVRCRVHLAAVADCLGRRGDAME